MNSYNMLMSVLSAFGQSSVHRLKFTFSALKSRFLDSATKFQEIFSSEGSQKNYRDAIKLVEAPAIPFMFVLCIMYSFKILIFLFKSGVYLSDLFFVDQGNPETVNGLINFRKRKLEYDIIIQILRFQGTSYPFSGSPPWPYLFNALY